MVFFRFCHLIKANNPLSFRSRLTIRLRRRRHLTPGPAVSEPRRDSRGPWAMAYARPSLRCSSLYPIPKMPDRPSASPHFELSSQNPVQQSQQRRASNRSAPGVLKTNTLTFIPRYRFLLSEENVRLPSPPIIALLHLRVRDQIGNLLVHVELFGRHRTDRVFESCAIERPFPIQDLVDRSPR